MRHRTSLGSVPGARPPSSGRHVPEEVEVEARISSKPQTQIKRLCESQHVYSGEEDGKENCTQLRRR